MTCFIEGHDRHQPSLLPSCVDDYIAPEALVRVVDAFVETLDLAALGFGRTVTATTGCPGFHPGDMLRLHVWGYLKQLRSSRQLERACERDLEAIWLMRRMSPDYRTIAAFRHDNPEAIVGAGAAFIRFCREAGLIAGGKVALDGTKMRVVASAKNIAGAERLARDIAHTEAEIAYYLDRLNIADEHTAQGIADQAVHRDAFAQAIGSLERRKARLERRQSELGDHNTDVVVFGEPDVRPMGYVWPRTEVPAYNMQSVANEANDSQLLHPMAMATKEVLEVDELDVLADGGYSNAQEVARCEQDGVRVVAPIKRGVMSAEYFRPIQFVHDEGTDTKRCPAGAIMHPKGKHTRNRAIRYRTPACQIKGQCTPGYQRTIHRLVDQDALDRMERRIHENPDLMTVRRCTVEHPFGTIKRMTGGGPFLTRGLRRVKAEAALSVLAFNLIRASNAFGATTLMARG
ncbi:transposase [Brucella pituitosa]|uniref:transposase n=1 Tax=Brucella pituitosa TaxID=571256 RepID=UPI002006541E|nr:transposase [Brucella pituitosa]MCK4207264.1 transposase [Brucella pituitosa]